ncbi:hypothetical protein niasHT_006430 [Heterodera trifolii]|uniref:USP8 dimerisation domain-containing protein n=1 Tax=Heterodera trifolii TaxID=157864 RepID=A0ABD2M2T8_9BILA
MPTSSSPINLHPLLYESYEVLKNYASDIDKRLLYSLQRLDNFSRLNFLMEVERKGKTQMQEGKEEDAYILYSRAMTIYLLISDSADDEFKRSRGGALFYETSQRLCEDFDKVAVSLQQRFMDGQGEESEFCDPLGLRWAEIVEEPIFENLGCDKDSNSSDAQNKILSILPANKTEPPATEEFSMVDNKNQKEEKEEGRDKETPADEVFEGELGFSRQVGGVEVVLSRAELEKLRRLEKPEIVVIGFKRLHLLKDSHGMGATVFVYPIESVISGSWPLVNADQVETAKQFVNKLTNTKFFPDDFANSVLQQHYKAVEMVALDLPFDSEQFKKESAENDKLIPYFKNQTFEQRVAKELEELAGIFETIAETKGKRESAKTEKEEKEGDEKSTKARKVEETQPNLKMVKRTTFEWQEVKIIKPIWMRRHSELEKSDDSFTNKMPPTAGAF